jgi:hypothetical protein
LAAKQAARFDDDREDRAMMLVEGIAREWNRHDSPQGSNRRNNLEWMMGCFIILGLPVIALGFVIMIVGRLQRVAARLRQDESAMQRAYRIIWIGFAIFIGGFAMMFLPSYISSQMRQ